MNEIIIFWNIQKFAHYLDLSQSFFSIWKSPIPLLDPEQIFIRARTKIPNFTMFNPAPRSLIKSRFDWRLGV